MFYDNKVCDGCSDVMLEGDDIVVCPECGTPQHRECYKKNNQCVNAHLHAEGFDWRTANAELEKEPEPVVENSATQEDEQAPRKIIPDFTSDGEIPEIPLPEFNIDGVYVNGQTFGADEDIGGATVREVVTYTQVNSRHYLKRFIKNKNKKNFVSWNWGAFFFGPAWFFYRKLYKAGAVLLTLAISATIAVMPLMPKVDAAAAKLEPLYNQLVEKLEAGVDETDEAAQAELEKLSEEITVTLKTAMPYSLTVLGATYVVSQIIPALIANSFYRKKMLDDIKFAKKATSDPKVLKFSLIRRGGVSFLAGLFATLAASHLPNIIMSIVSYF